MTGSTSSTSSPRSSTRASSGALRSADPTGSPCCRRSETSPARSCRPAPVCSSPPQTSARHALRRPRRRPDSRARRYPARPHPRRARRRDRQPADRLAVLGRGVRPRPTPLDARRPLGVPRRSRRVPRRRRVEQRPARRVGDHPEVTGAGRGGDDAAGEPGESTDDDAWLHRRGRCRVQAGTRAGVAAGSHDHPRSGVAGSGHLSPERIGVRQDRRPGPPGARAGRAGGPGRHPCRGPPDGRDRVRLRRRSPGGPRAPRSGCRSVHTGDARLGPTATGNQPRGGGPHRLWSAALDGRMAGPGPGRRRRSRRAGEKAEPPVQPGLCLLPHRLPRARPPRPGGSTIMGGRAACRGGRQRLPDLASPRLRPRGRRPLRDSGLPTRAYE